MSQKKITSILTLLVSAALIWFLYPHLQNPIVLQNLILNLGWVGILLDLAILCIQMVFPVVPFALLAGINVILFGWVGGFLISLTGSILGSSLGFWLARALGQEWAKPKLKKLGKWADLPESRSFYLILLARLIPVLPAAAVNYAAGLSPMKFRSFILATLIGKIPMIAWESLVGHDFWHLFEHPLRFALALLSGVLVFGSALIMWRLSEKKLKKQALENSHLDYEI